MGHCVATLFKLLCSIELLNPLTDSKVPMAEWNAYYRNDDEEEEQEEGDQSGGEVKAITFHHHRL